MAMTNDQQKLLNIVDASINKFNTFEEYLIQVDLSERCICAKFAQYLHNEIKNSTYKEYEVDVEYNRGNEENERSSKRLRDKNIVVDLIVHKRGFDAYHGFDNLICIEMKKSTDRRGTNQDEERLKDMTNYDYGFNYKLGLMLVVDMELNQMFIKEQFYL